MGGASASASAGRPVHLSSVKPATTAAVQALRCAHTLVLLLCSITVDLVWEGSTGLPRPDKPLKRETTAGVPLVMAAVGARFQVPHAVNFLNYRGAAVGAAICSTGGSSRNVTRILHTRAVRLPYRHRAKGLHPQAKQGRAVADAEALAVFGRRWRCTNAVGLMLTLILTWAAHTGATSHAGFARPTSTSSATVVPMMRR